MKELLIGILIVLVGAGVSSFAYYLQVPPLAVVGGVITGLGLIYLFEEAL